MSTILIVNTLVVNEGTIEQKDVYIKDGIIERVGNDLSGLPADKTIGEEGWHLIPGVIDTQVHLRDYEQSAKGTVFKESQAAILGGVTSFIEQPNTNPQIISLSALAERNAHNAKYSLCNFGVNFGATLDNYDDVMRLDLKQTPGVKVFWGSSTGGMLVNDPYLVAKMGASSPAIFIFHSEDEKTIKENFERHKRLVAEGKETMGAHLHPLIRNERTCELSTDTILDIAHETGMRTHVYHISTANEIPYFENSLPLAKKQITAEVCIPHLHFTSEDYKGYGNLIKCNPAIKAPHHRDALWEALLDNRIDVVATDHAPHTFKEKLEDYWTAPSGIPSIQYSLNILLEYYRQGKISLERIVEKMCHNPAICFRIKNRGFIREGYAADLALVNLSGKTEVSKKTIKYKCNWSPFDGQVFDSKVECTIVNGVIKQAHGHITNMTTPGKKLEYEVA